MTREGKKGNSGFWKRNWLMVGMVGGLFWMGFHFWHFLWRLSPYLLIVHTFFLYLFIVKLLYDNRSLWEGSFARLRDAGWRWLCALARPLAAIYTKCAAGLDLLTQRMGAEQELIIAEKRMKRLEIELSRKQLHELLSEPLALPATETVSDKEADQPIEVDKKMFQPPYSKYGKTLLDYLHQVDWDKFTVSQAQQVLHKRFGTTKLVLEELVNEQKLEYVRNGRQLAYRLVPTGKDEK